MDAGCGGGLTINGYTYYMTNGANSEAEYPYTSGKFGLNGKCLYSAATATNLNVTGYVTVPFDDVD